MAFDDNRVHVVELLITSSCPMICDFVKGTNVNVIVNLRAETFVSLGNVIYLGLRTHVIFLR